MGMPRSSYPNLETMLRSNIRARAYFRTLPDHVRIWLSACPAGIHSPESLQSRAEQLLGMDM